jgi:hypothetical protein
MSLLEETGAGLASVEKVRQILLREDVRFLGLWPGPRQNDPVEMHPLGQESAFVSPEYPAVIYDDGAAFCSQVISFDRLGNALLLHGAFASGADYSWNLRRYFDALPTHLTGNEVVGVIGGTNIEVNDAGKKPIDVVINYVEDQMRSKFPEVEYLSLVSKQHENQTGRSPVAPDDTKMRGLLFIPRYLARNDRHHLLGIVDGEDRKLREAFRIG